MSPRRERRREGLGMSTRAGIFLLAIFLAVPVPAQGPPPEEAARRLTLEEALRIALARNKDLRKALEFRRQVEGRYVEERAAALPQLQFAADGSARRDESQKALGEFVPPESRGWSAEASVSQALFTWGQIGAAIRAAKIGVATADDQLRIFRQAVVRDVTVAFYDVLLARDLLRIAGETLSQRERQLEEARKKLAAGTATDYDVLAAEVEVQNARPLAIRAENRLRGAREALRFLLGGVEGPVDAEGSLLVEVEAYPGYREMLSQAVANRPELSELRHRVGIAEELVRIANAGDKPRLDLSGSYGYRGLSIPDGESDEGVAWSAGVFLSWPFFDGLRTRGQVARARSEAATLRIEEEKLLDAIALETRNAVDAVRDAGEIVRGISGTVAQARRLYQLAEKGYVHGVKTKLEVDDAQLNLARAEGNLAQGRRDYLAARVTLEYVTGSLAEGAEELRGEEPAWTPPGSSLGIVGEVLRGEPVLSR